MDASAINAFVIAVVAAIVFFYVLHVVIRSAVGKAISDSSRQEKRASDGALPTPPETDS